MFEVTYDPAGVDAGRFEMKLETMGYKPRLKQAIAATAETKALTLQTMPDKLVYKRGSKGTVVVGLFPKRKKTIGGEGQEPTVVSLEGEGLSGLAAQTETGQLKRRKIFRLGFKVGKKMKKGVHEVKLKVRYQAKKGEPRELVILLSIEVG